MNSASVLICQSNTINNYQKGLVFSSVLKNLTLANRILQEIIKKYGHIQNMYQIEDLLPSGSSSNEIYQINNNLLTNKQNTQQRGRSYEKYVTTNSPYIGTAIIYNSESIENESHKNKQKKNEKPFILNSYNVQSKNKNINTNLNKKDKLTYAKFGKYKTPSKDTSLEDVESEEIQQILIEIPKEEYYVTTNTNERILKRKLNKPETNLSGAKTRFTIQHSAPKLKDNTNISKMILREKINKRRGRKVTRSQKSQPNKIWYDILNKPVKLKEEREVNNQKYTSNKSDSKKNKTITVLLFTNNEKVIFYGDKEPKLSISYKTEGTTKFDLLNDVLRSDYGYSCLKLPIKKCKKAIQTAIKNICKIRFKCKSDFKEDFIQNSKNGCDKEFAYKEETAEISDANIRKENIEKISPLEFRELKMIQNKRDRYNIKLLARNKSVQRFKPPQTETPDEEILRIRTLRDKYVKKCQKESAKKCNKACHHALTETCSVHTCEKRKKKAIQSECKNECKKAYEHVKNSVKSSRSSVSDSGSDSASDNNSESN